jgi:hypothetical protein
MRLSCVSAHIRHSADEPDSEQDGCERVDGHAAYGGEPEEGNMNGPKWLQVVGVTLGVLLLVACGSQGPKAELETAGGTMVVTQVQLADRFPPDCKEDSTSCDKAQEGQRYLIVWMGWSDVKGPGLSADEMGKLSTFVGESGDAYVTAGDGSRIELGGNGMQLGRPFILFRVPKAARDFTLYWPDNPPVDLGK